MKAIILCAGKGSRTGLSYPKCLYRFKNNFILIERNLTTLKKLGFKNNDIIFGTGFKDKLIKKATKNSFTYIKNKKYNLTNMVYSLQEVIKSGIVDDIYIIYADIIFDSKSFKKLIKSKNHISTLIDKDWLKKWKLKRNYMNDLEELKIKGSKILSLGKKTKNLKNIDGRFLGITKFSKTILKAFITKKVIERKLDSNKKIDFTNFLMKLINDGFKVNAIKLRIDWFEFDTKYDFSTYEKKYLK